jgi:hypothetical protein
MRHAEIFQSPFDAHIIAALEASKKTHAREAMRSAIEHLRLAEPLFKLDVNMAVFRCITAVEEASTSLMLLLQDKEYPRSSEVKRTNHLYKNAMLPFIRILHQRFLRIAVEKNIHIDLRLYPNIHESLGIEVVIESVDGSTESLSTSPPLNFLLSEDGLGVDATLDVDAFIKREGFDSIKAYLKKETNLRNLLLYASPAGIPRVSIDAGNFFPAYQQRVRVMLCAYLLIEPYGKQLAVTHCLDAYLDLVSRFKGGAADSVTPEIQSGL